MSGSIQGLCLQAQRTLKSSNLGLQCNHEIKPSMITRCGNNHNMIPDMTLKSMMACMYKIGCFENTIKIDDLAVNSPESLGFFIIFIIVRACQDETRGRYYSKSLSRQYKRMLSTDCIMLDSQTRKR